jgi:hypothetical protein
MIHLFNLWFAIIVLVRSKQASMGYIFISYSHKDKDYVHKLQTKIETEGFEVWIDGRIDYGEKWPKVIQEQLDGCDAFIVVISENSYESEWVQNEVTRAKRKMKPFFPLLLSGDAWLSVETTQYVDVRDRTLPESDFFEKIGKYIERSQLNLTHNPEWITTEWLTHVNHKHGYSFKHPPEGEITIANDDVFRLDLPVVTNTDILEKYISVRCIPGTEFRGSVYDGLGEHYGDFVTKRTVNINGEKCLFEIFRDAGMSKSGELITYTKSSRDVFICFTLCIIITDQGAYSYLLPKMDLAAEKELILYVIHTFAWLS